MEKFLHNNKILLERRRTLRKNPTEEERIVWQKLNRNQIGNLRFFRQYSLGPYILDFYCPKKSLAIEIDGPSHSTTDAQIYDDERSRYLESLGVRIIRFKNEAVIRNVDLVIIKISRVVASP